MPTKIMGILNTTPDSFYEKSRFQKLDLAIARAIEMEKQGADYIDIGGCSTRPGSTPPSIVEEIQRTIPLIKELKKEISIPLSIDTYRVEVARLAIESGATFLNDVTGFTDPLMRELAKESGVELCAMHMNNHPASSSDSYSYSDGVAHEIFTFLKQKGQELESLGIPKEKIFLDPGIGSGKFGKTVEDNLMILQDLDKLREAGFPLLVGISRKTFIRKLTGHPPEKALYGTLGINSLLIERGIDLIRVYDVQAHRDLINVIEPLKKVKLSYR